MKIILKKKSTGALVIWGWFFWFGLGFGGVFFCAFLVCFVFCFGFGGVFLVGFFGGFFLSQAGDAKSLDSIWGH